MLLFSLLSWNLLDLSSFFPPFKSFDLILLLWKLYIIIIIISIIILVIIIKLLLCVYFYSLFTLS